MGRVYGAGGGGAELQHGAADQQHLGQTVASAPQLHMANQLAALSLHSVITAGRAAQQLTAKSLKMA